jgi:hypothetical protein
MRMRFHIMELQTYFLDIRVINDAQPRLHRCANSAYHTTNRIDPGILHSACVLR